MRTITFFLGASARMLISVAAVALAALGPFGATPAHAQVASLAADVLAELNSTEQKYGINSLELADALISLARRLESAGRYSEAITLGRRALVIQERRMGANTVGLVPTLYMIASQEFRAGNYPAALQLFQRSQAIHEGTPGANDLNLAAILNGQAILYRTIGQYAQAMPFYKRALDIYEKKLGAEHPFVAIALDNLAQVQMALGKFADARGLLHRSLAIAEKALGPESLELAGTLNSLAVLYVKLGLYPEALPLLQRSLTIEEKVRGPDDVSVAISLNNLADLRRTLGQNALAFPLYQRSLAIQEKVLGAHHVDVANTLGNLGQLYRTTGQYELALPALKRSLTIREKVLGPNHEDVAGALNNLAELFNSQGHYAKALPLYQRSLAIVERALGSKHVDVATVLSNLGGLYGKLDHQELALPLYQRSLSIREEVLGPDHEDVASSLSDLAGLYVHTGQYALALPLMRRSLLIREKAFGANHELVATSLNNLSELYGAIGQRDQAILLQKRSLAQMEAALGPMHINIATNLNNLGTQYLLAGQYSEALPLLLRSQAISESKLGPDHQDVAVSLTNLAVLRINLRQPEAALALLLRSRAVFETALGPSHVYVAGVLTNLAMLQHGMGQRETSLKTYQQSITIAFPNAGAREVQWGAAAGLARLYEDMGEIDTAIFWGKLAVNTLQSLRAEFGTSNKLLASDYLESRRWVYARLTSLLLSQERFAEAEAVMQMQRERELYEDITRGVGVSSSGTQVNLSLQEQRKKAELEKNTLQYLDQLREYKNLTGRKDKLTPQERARIAELSRLVGGLSDGLQTFWASLGGDLRPTFERDKVANVEGTQTRLQAIVNDASRATAGKGPVVALQYVVSPSRITIVLTSSDLPVPLRFVQPVSHEDLRKLVNPFKAELSTGVGDLGIVKEKGHQLYQLLIDPVLPKLRQLRPSVVLLWTNDILRRAPFAALFDGNRYLVEEGFAVVQFNDLATALNGESNSRNARMAAFGFSREVQGEPKLKPLFNVPAEVRSVSRHWPGSSRWLDSVSTGGEADGPFTLKTLNDALGKAKAGQVQMLHIASHFVLVAGEPERSRLYLGDQTTLSLGDVERKDLKFSGLDLVTLSACSTALDEGRNSNNQEMQSLSSIMLRRGARAVMASMWDVETSSTEILMERFYEQLKAGRNKAEALRNAQLAMLRPEAPAGSKQSANTSAKWQHPFFWAPMILTGEWR